MLMPWRALANRLGQMGSTSTLAAFRMVVILSAVTATSSSASIRAEYVQASSFTDAIFDYYGTMPMDGLK